MPAGKGFTLVGASAMKQRLAALGRNFALEMERGLREEAEAIMTDSKANYVPVDLGTLRSSGRVGNVTRKGLVVEVKLEYGDASSPYALCVFTDDNRPTPRVLVEGGRRDISSVREGDRVLTQTGEYKRVLAVTRFPAAAKPDLVDIVARWRHGSEHRLTLTRDHKVLCRRSGRRSWVAAADLRPEDMVFHRTKKAHNYGTRRYSFRCCMCNAEFKPHGGRQRDNQYIYCSMECRNRGYRTHRHPSLGKSRDPETMRPAAVARATKRWGGGGTECERAIERWLIRRGVPYEREVVIGSLAVDFFLPESNTIIEADGAYWHQDQGADIDRDRKLLLTGPVDVRIIHVHFYDQKHSPECLDEHPLPGVFYVSCNPGPESYADPEIFEPTPVISVTPWHYNGFTAPLYDLSVEGVHSFVAGGLVISNSVHEHPSSISPPSWEGKAIEEIESVRAGQPWVAEGSGRGPKYLERPLNAALPGMAGRIAEKMRV